MDIWNRNKGLTTNSANQAKITDRRFERKFFIIPGKQFMALAILRQICRADREYPECRVNSLYFDTPDLDEYNRSEAGDFYKNKVRIRWYDEPAPDYTQVFLELKSREGFASKKQRVRLLVPSERVLPQNLADGIVAKSFLLDTLAGFGFFPNKPLRPVIFISYRRYRFNEISTGTRVSFDQEVTAFPLVPELGNKDRIVKLAGGVIEIKGQKLELPVPLRRIKLLDTDWSRFSKYSNCIDACLSGSRDMHRYLPPGRLNTL